MITETEVTVDQNYAVWLDGLESGKYKQTCGTLFDGEGHCCLGVADREVFGAEFTYNVDLEDWTDELGRAGTLDTSRARKLKLLEKANLAEIELCNEVVGQEVILCIEAEYISRQGLLTSLNDNGATFEQIAEFIRRCGWHLE